MVALPEETTGQSSDLSLLVIGARKQTGGWEHAPGNIDSAFHYARAQGSPSIRQHLGDGGERIEDKASTKPHKSLCGKELLDAATRRPYDASYQDDEVPKENHIAPSEYIAQIPGQSGGTCAGNRPGADHPILRFACSQLSSDLRGDRRHAHQRKTHGGGQRGGKCLGF